MPKVELLRPRSLNTRGILFVQRVPREDIPVDIALELMEDERFKVTGITAADLAATGDKPRKKADLHAAILDAIDELDVDDEDAFTASGKPHHLAISKVLGFDISAEERDAAMRAGTARGALVSGEGEGHDKEEAAPAAKPAKKAGKGGVVINRGKQQAKKEELLTKLNTVGGEKPAEQEKEPEDAGTGEDQEIDDSTDGALEV
ncbi:hypothetical protein KXR64_16795 [Brucella intermedia]|uniref:hypothetical protein n=1 Tax=Brucella TaxID=234 RepID=UPI0009462262|nr:hypothetical protein [Brucella intermedia]